MSIYSERPWLKSHDEHVSPDIPIPEVTYLDFLMKGLTANPDHIAFYFLGKACTFGELDELSDRFAAFLVDTGCQKGDVVGIHLPNLPQYLVAVAGTIKAGCVGSGVSPLLAPREIAHQLNDSGAKVFVTLDALFQDKIVDIADRIPKLEQVVVTNIADFLPAFKAFLGKLLKKIPTGKIVPLKGKEVVAYKQVIASYPPKRPQVDLTPDDTCMLQYTGGTTGPSKGAVLTHRNIASDQAQFAQWLNSDMNPDADLMKDCKRGKDVFCSGFPLFHIAGLALGLQALTLGSTQILVPDPRNTDRICEDMKKYKPNVLVNVPTLYQLLMDNPAFAAVDFSHLKYAISGAAAFDKETMKRLESFIGEGKVMEMYGMTETSPLIAANPVLGRKKLGSIGLPAQNTKIKIVSVGDGTTEQPIGEPGELIVAGPQVMKEYHGNSEATAKSKKEIGGDAYLYTGDVAMMDEDGYLYIVDRTKDMILVGGYNVYSRQVEETLYEIPEIEHCAVIGVDNPERPGSEIVKAVIQLTESVKNQDEDTLRDKVREYCKENLAPYKVPKIIEFITEIPQTSVGKIDKKVLRK
jgi:acyl-CoA synthetase (AMP-forming)/AMP-acid ligase II